MLVQRHGAAPQQLVILGPVPVVHIKLEMAFAVVLEREDLVEDRVRRLEDRLRAMRYR